MFSVIELKMIQNLKNQLSQEVVQRVVYGLGLVLWTILSWDKISNFSDSTSSLGIKYSTLYLIPAVILSLQIILNHRILWGLIFGLATTSTLAALYNVVTDAIERSGNHVKAINWDLRDIGILTFVFGFAVLVDIVIYMIRPKRKGTSSQYS